MSDATADQVADTPKAPRRPMARSVIRWIFVSQIIMAGILVGRDLASSGFAALDWPGNNAPRIDEPVRPGDQTRRFSPNRIPARTGAPPGDRPYPDSGELPDRLEFATVGIGADAALSLTGQIAIGDAIRFADHLQTLRRPPVRIWLRSPGGSVTDALAIGQRLSVRAERVVVPLRLHCIVASILDLALESRKRVVVKFDLAAGHAADHDYFVLLAERERLVNLWSVEELESDFADKSICLRVHLITEVHDHV